MNLLTGLSDLLSANVHWAAPWAFALFLLPVIAILLRLTTPAAVRFPRDARTLGLPKSIRQRLIWLPTALRFLALSTLILAIARPQIGEGKAISSTDAVAIQLTIDRSGSMDLPIEIDGRETSRLTAAKQILKEFLLGNGKDLTGRTADLIGVVQFAGFASTACPLIRDHVALQQLVDAIPIAQMQMENGTAIGDGLALAAARLKTAEEDLKTRHSELSNEDFRIKSKAIILLTDGDNNAGEQDPVEAAKLAGQWGIKIYAIGIGSDSYKIMRSPIFGDQRIPVPSDLNEGLLRSIAEVSGGKYWIATSGEALREIYKEIDRLEKSNIKTVDYTEYRELFAPLAVLAGLLAALEVLLSSTLLRRTP